MQAASQSGILAQQEGASDVARKGQAIKRHVAEFQDCIQSVEKCEKRRYPFARTCGAFIDWENSCDSGASWI